MASGLVSPVSIQSCPQLSSPALPSSTSTGTRPSRLALRTPHSSSSERQLQAAQRGDGRNPGASAKRRATVRSRQSHPGTMPGADSGQSPSRVNSRPAAFTCSRGLNAPSRRAPPTQPAAARAWLQSSRLLNRDSSAGQAKPAFASISTDPSRSLERTAGVARSSSSVLPKGQDGGARQSCG